MDMDHAWMPCRLLPMDGSSLGRQARDSLTVRRFARRPMGRRMGSSSRQRRDGGSGLFAERGVAGAPRRFHRVELVGWRRRGIRFRRADCSEPELHHSIAARRAVSENADGRIPFRTGARRHSGSSEELMPGQCLAHHLVSTRSIATTQRKSLSRPHSIASSRERPGSPPVIRSRPQLTNA